ncbi:hypothetical protein VPH35_134176 [Triticum aestivum]|uniref:ent-cassadiene hydroxylase-like n=1 Tax=Triticum aestivum TaxID=4565 RepID=UPI001D01B274|nr:ent-cassadiene hydroxylase-like [Triticum aestivum]
MHFTTSMHDGLLFPLFPFEMHVALLSAERLAQAKHVHALQQEKGVLAPSYLNAPHKHVYEHSKHGCDESRASPARTPSLMGTMCPRVRVWSIGRHPELWDAPEEFRPERFIGSKIDVKGQDLELLPFGSGRRMCPGYNLGLKEVRLSLANLLHGFTWTLPDGMAKEELSIAWTWFLG